MTTAAAGVNPPPMKGVQMAKKDKEKSAREPYYLTIVSDTGCARKHSAGGSADAPAEG